MWEIEFAAGAERDFALIFDHLVESYTDLGEDIDCATMRAADRLRQIRSSLDVFQRSPFMGTLRPDIRPGLRFVRQDKAAIWFIPDEVAHRVLIVAVFFGGQDHIRHMLARLLSGPDG